VENDPFARVPSRLKGAQGGLLFLVDPDRKGSSAGTLKKASASAIFVVSDNRGAETYCPFCKALPSSWIQRAGIDRHTSYRDVLPFQNLSPHPDIGEERAAALWKISTAPFDRDRSIAATTIRLASTEVLHGSRAPSDEERRSTGTAAQHPKQVGYAATDVVQMRAVYLARRHSGCVFA
jgi:transcription-repair coupling factor (superfamily II helicase)